MWTMVSHIERMSSSEYPAVFMLLKNRIISGLVRKLFAWPSSSIMASTRSAVHGKSFSSDWPPSWASRDSALLQKIAASRGFRLIEMYE